MRALILSAGLGERLRPLTLKRAKPAIEFLNVPMLGFPYFWLDTLGLSDVVFNTHYLPDTVRHAAMHVVSPNTQLHFTHEEEILGSGGGIWNARFHLQWDKNFCVANADGVVVFSAMDILEQMLRFHEKQDALATLLVCPLEGVGTRIPGVWLDKYGEVTNFGKTPKKDYLECQHFASYMIFSSRIWNYLPAGSSNVLYDILEPAILAGERVCGFRVDESHMRWFETGNIPEYLASTHACLEYLRDNHPFATGLRQMLERFAPNYLDPKKDFLQMRLISDTAELSGNLTGWCVVGSDARVRAAISDCVVLPGAEVREPAHNTVLI